MITITTSTSHRKRTVRLEEAAWRLWDVLRDVGKIRVDGRVAGQVRVHATDPAIRETITFAVPDERFWNFALALTRPSRRAVCAKMRIAPLNKRRVSRDNLRRALKATVQHSQEDVGVRAA